MDKEEAEQFIAKEMSKQTASHDTRLKMTFIRQKTDPSKIFVFARCDHTIADGNGFLQTFANLQDNREGNCVPCPKKKASSFMQIKNKFGGFKKLQDIVEERKSTTKQLGFDAKSRNN